MKKNIYIFYLISFFQTLTFTTAIWSFFFTSYLTFSFWQALFLITLVWITSIIFEIPTWAWADRFWRKNMFILWTSFILLNLVFWSLASNFYLFIFSSILCWIWYALTSWNLEALIHDKLEEENNRDEFKNISANSFSILFLGRALSASISWLLFVINPLLPIQLTILSTIIILIFALNLNEPKQVISNHKNNFSHLKETWNYLKRNKFMILFMINLWLISWLGNIYFFTQQPYFLSIWYSIEFIWLTFTIWALFSSLGSYLFKKFNKYFSDKQIIYIMLSLIFISSIIYAIFIKSIALIALCFLSIMFWFVVTFWNNYLIKKSPKNQKSTILSIFSFFLTLWYSVFNIILAISFDKVWINIIYYIIIFLISILIILNIFIFNRKIT